MSINTTIDNLRTAISQSAKFQTLVGGNEAAALAKVKRFGETSITSLPRAYIGTGTKTSPLVATNLRVARGTLRVVFNLSVPTGNYDAAANTAAGDMDTIMEQACTAADTSQAIIIRGWSRDRFALDETTTDATFFLGEYSVDFGPEV